MPTRALCVGEIAEPAPELGAPLLRRTGWPQSVCQLGNPKVKVS